jgi:hypothetical protein
MHFAVCCNSLDFERPSSICTSYKMHFSFSLLPVPNSVLSHSNYHVRLGKELPLITLCLAE